MGAGRRRPGVLFANRVPVKSVLPRTRLSSISNSHHARLCRRNRRLQSRPTEDRERDLQRTRTNGYNLGHNFGHGCGCPANLPTVPDPPAFAAHTACDLGEAARQRTPNPRRPQAPVRAHAHARRSCALPLIDRPRRHPRHRRPTTRRRPNSSKPPPQTPTEPPNGSANPIMRIAVSQRRVFGR